VRTGHLGRQRGEGLRRQLPVASVFLNRSFKLTVATVGCLHRGNRPCLEKIASRFLRPAEATKKRRPSGQERTVEEYRDLLARAGFHLERVVPTASPVSVIEAIRA
jgi:hypothetical protein